MLKAGLLGKNLSFSTQIMTDVVRILAEGKIHSDPRGTAVKSWGKNASVERGGRQWGQGAPWWLPLAFCRIHLQAKTSLLSPGSAWLSGH